ncbi:hypothetical protein [Pseudoduganella umbonata]|uniref:Serine/threonine protein kinase n=1 Tax=Pseudoduganella umbonata TaxID=864828 RepID=A0A4P8HIQ2_9BURK|nr:hypothetical protein [Pseudoduganella umbonata]MBB3219462.1 hypothetical protein [Pseudoduganella umbonata]QCP09549.1 hypothetical protein FCL38_03265 [Pseudoduganella umbonata]
MHIHLIAAVAALAFTGAASAQSHSVSNMANPPQTQSDNKAATEATPGKTATATRNSNKQADKNAGQARNAPTARQAGKKVETSGSSMTGERVGAGSSATATTGIGAGNGDKGAEGAMEIKPSEAYVNPVERNALDEAPKSGQK